MNSAGILRKGGNAKVAGEFESNHQLEAFINIPFIKSRDDHSKNGDLAKSMFTVLPDPDFNGKGSVLHGKPLTIGH